MKLKIRTLFWTFLLFYLNYEPLRVLLDTQDITEAIYALKGGVELALFVSNLLYLWIYVLLAYLVFFRYYPQGRRVESFALLVPVALTAIFFRYFLQEVLGAYFFNVTNYAPGTSIQYYIFDNLYYAIIYVSVGTIFFFVQYARHKEVQQRELLLQNQKTELAFLRSQLNPHFLFNMLNNIYSLIYYKSANALTAVEKLSALLRYALYEKSDKVAVKKEVAYLNDFIDLHNLRLEEEMPVDMQLEADTFSCRIAPFLLIPFVENAVKHGNLKDPQRPLRIHLRKTPDQLEFVVENEKRLQEKDDLGGIGIPHLRKRLALIYGEQAQLTINETDTQFGIHLKIALAAC